MTLRDIEQLELHCQHVFYNDDEFTITEEQFKDLIALAKIALEIKNEVR